MALVAVVLAVLFTSVWADSCNPLLKACPAVPAVGKTVTCDFTRGGCDLFAPLQGTVANYSDSKGVVLSIAKEGNAPTFQSTKQIFFGRVDVEVQAAPGRGIVTSAVLQSDILDEIDWEWLGFDNAHVQSSFFGQGEVTSSTDRNSTLAVPSPIDSFHNYSIVWNSSSITWLIDGKTARTVKGAGRTLPQTPMAVKFGTWVAGGKASPVSTRDWAGGLTNFADGPFVAFVKSITVVDYVGGNEPGNGSAKQYLYSDTSANWQSIQVLRENKTTTETTHIPTQDDVASGQLSVAAKAGIGVGVALGVVILIAAVAGVLWYRRRISQQHQKETSAVELETEKRVELDVKTPVEAEGDEYKPTAHAELETNPPIYELDGSARPPGSVYDWRGDR